MLTINRSEINSCLRKFDAGYRHFLLRTPLWKLPGAAFGLACAEVWLKLEHLQTGGSFKARGMLNRLLCNPIRASGVIVASGGNAGIATAAAARLLGVRCEVFVPTTSSPAKQARLAELGAHVQVVGDHYAQALQACLTRQRETEALLTHAYDQSEVIIGAGTLAAEIDAQAGQEPSSILVSCGGGGLVAGIAAWYEGRSRVIALEPELAPTLHAARAAGRPVEVGVGGVAADALGAQRIGELAWPITREHVSNALLLSDVAIQTAQRWLWRELKLAVEPAAALGLAALQTGAYTVGPSDKVCLVLCGANMNLASLE